MPPKGPGGRVPARPSDADGAWYAWKHTHPAEAEDPRAIWHAGVKWGGHAVLIDSNEIGQLAAQMNAHMTALLVRWAYFSLEHRAQNERADQAEDEWLPF
jgi:hypothetical protein